MKAGATRFAPLKRVLNSHLEEVDQACQELRVYCRHHKLDSLSFRLELALRECLNNAILHGSGGDFAKRVVFALRQYPRGVSLRITDEGAGFNWRSRMRMPPVDCTATTGRGLAIATTCADRVRFNARGNQITLWFQKDKQAGAKHE